MTNGTAEAAVRPPVPHEAPEGRRWVPAPAPGSGVRPARDDGPCRWRGSADPAACGAPNVVEHRHGVTRVSWWRYCLEHGGGYWVEAGEDGVPRVMQWVLVDA